MVCISDLAPITGSSIQEFLRRGGPSHGATLRPPHHRVPRLPSGGRGARSSSPWPSVNGGGRSVLWRADAGHDSVTPSSKRRRGRARVAAESVRPFARYFMITLGIILLIIGFIVGIPILWTLGVILLVIGLILAVLGMAGRSVGGRRHYY